MSSLRERLRAEHGVSLAEMMVTIVVLGFVMAAILSLLDVTGRIAPRDAERSQAVRGAQVGLDRMSREIRQATSAGFSTPQQADIQLQLGGVDTHVTYNCAVANGTAGYPVPAADPNHTDYKNCVRTDVATGRKDLVLARVTNTSVFCVTSPCQASAQTNPTYLTISVQVPSRGERTGVTGHTVVLDDGVYLRNIDYAAG